MNIKDKCYSLYEFYVKRKKYKLKNRNTKKIGNLSFPLLSLLLLFFGIGFAYVESELSINGDFKIGNNLWNIHYDGIFVPSTNTAKQVSAPTIDEKDTSIINFGVNFKKFTDIYEFEFDVVNSGGINAKVSSVSIDGLPSGLGEYINAKILYSNGDEVQENDALPFGNFERIKISLSISEDMVDFWLSQHPDVGTLTYEENINLNLNFSLSFQLSYSQDFGDSNKRIKPSLIQLLKLDKRAISDVGINFATAPTEATSGLYVVNDTLERENPIYYYRGIVNNNNVYFAGFCWKIVRTTEMGGTKLIYNGTATNKQCLNTTGTSTQISTTSVFNTLSTSLADAGYMYGKRNVYVTHTTSTKYLYGNDVSYDEENKIYTLIDTGGETTTATALLGDGMQRHYTCKSATEESCATVYYVYTYYSTTAYALALNGSANIEDEISQMFANTNESPLLNTLNTWYEDNIEKYGYTKYLEDAIWCNDRTITSGGLQSKDAVLVGGVGAYFASYLLTDGGRGLYNTTTPEPSVIDDLVCPNDNDKFTTINASYGNKKLKYPVGLLTADEITMAGNGNKASNTTSYLYSGQYIWTLTPGYIGTTAIYNWRGYNALVLTTPNTTGAIRPSIVLKAYTKVASGEGTSTNPYVIE